MKKKSKWVGAVKTILILIIVSIVVSLFVSFLLGDEIDLGDNNVAIIEISGPIVAKGESGGLLFSDLASADDIRKLIKKADEDDGVKAIVFEINSPGGSAVASDEIALEIKKTNKTTVAWIREVGASGGYWIASSTDHIIANRMSITGSIGVISSYLSFGGFLQDHNVTYERLVAGDLKDLGTPLREMTPEERAIFQDSLDQIHQFFIEEVAENRDMRVREVEKVATGAFYIGAEAYKLGLVDELGSRDEVTAYLENELDMEVDFIRYRTDRGFFNSLGVSADKSFYLMGKGLGSSLFSQSGLQIIT